MLGLVPGLVYSQNLALKPYGDGEGRTEDIVGLDLLPFIYSHTLIIKHILKM